MIVVPLLLIGLQAATENARGPNHHGAGRHSLFTVRPEETRQRQRAEVFQLRRARTGFKPAQRSASTGVNRASCSSSQCIALTAPPPYAGQLALAPNQPHG